MRAFLAHPGRASRSIAVLIVAARCAGATASWAVSFGFGLRGLCLVPPPLAHAWCRVPIRSCERSGNSSLTVHGWRRWRSQLKDGLFGAARRLESPAADVHRVMIGWLLRHMHRSPRRRRASWGVGAGASDCNRVHTPGLLETCYRQAEPSPKPTTHLLAVGKPVSPSPLPRVRRAMVRGAGALLTKAIVSAG